VGELSGFAESQNSFYIFTLIEKKIPSDEDFEKEKDAFKKQLIARKEQMAFQKYLNQLVQDIVLEENVKFFEKYQF